MDIRATERGSVKKASGQEGEPEGERGGERERGDGEKKRECERERKRELIDVMQSVMNCKYIICSCF